MQVKTHNDLFYDTTQGHVKLSAWCGFTELSEETFWILDFGFAAFRYQSVAHRVKDHVSRETFNVSFLISDCQTPVLTPDIERVLLQDLTSLDKFMNLTLQLLYFRDPLFSTSDLMPEFGYLLIQMLLCVSRLQYLQTKDMLSSPMVVSSLCPMLHYGRFIE